MMISGGLIGFVVWRSGRGGIGKICIPILMIEGASSILTIFIQITGRHRYMFESACMPLLTAPEFVEESALFPPFVITCVVSDT